MTAMVRITLDLPARTEAQALQRLATDAGGLLFRRPDGTFVIRPSDPRPQAEPGEVRA